jgi:hypothetical protein
LLLSGGGGRRGPGARAPPPAPGPQARGAALYYVPSGNGEFAVDDPSKRRPATVFIGVADQVPDEAQIEPGVEPFYIGFSGK